MFPFYTPVKTSENQRFSDVFRGYRKGTLAWNGLIKIPWYSCFIWHKCGKLNWLEQLLHERLSSFNLEGFCYSYVWCSNLYKRGILLHVTLPLNTLIILIVLDWLCSIQRLISFFFCWSPPIFCPPFLMLSHQTKKRLSQSTSLLMYISLDI